ncbi:hypothetical protein ENSA5_52950 [Enhygromyxa salina]|uniref:Uncharacterized protein n=1 Tax=Enhygromyxa salina TaxID=215803 RepID=A0A2S9XFS5_9BACT|nr:hypothetical protein [Enhygromyxa salina]PRP91715.1 hypothetical protein ENSA5_52950 [Enhygromyxa salina]
MPLRRRQRWAAWAVAITTLNWCVVDTSLSAAHGVGVNVAFNLVALSSVAVPLATLTPWLRCKSADAPIADAPSG